MGNNTKNGILSINLKERGITLIALIITVIVLVILSAVGISAVYKSKIVEYATEGATEYAKESLKENRIMEGTEGLLDSTVQKIGDILSGNIPEAGTQVTKPTEWTSGNVTAVGDGAGNSVPLPKEFYYIGGDINTGIVISDRKEDTLESSGVEMRKSICLDTCKKCRNVKKNRIC